MEPGDGRRRRRKQYLNMEMILRKSFNDSVQEYAKSCCLPGVGQMCDPRIGKIERLIRVTAFGVGLITCCLFLVHVWKDTLTKPFIITLESSTYPIANVDFPAVALCNINRISMKALHQLAEQEYPDIARGESLEDVKNVLVNLGSLIDFTHNESIRNHPILTRFVEKYRMDSQKIVNIMKKLAPDCSEMLIKCSWAGNLADCRNIFTTRRTAYGHCCIFNSVVNYDTISKPPTVAEKKFQSEPGIYYGLNVLLDPHIEDYAYPTNAMLGFHVMLFDPLNYAEPHSGRIIHRISEPNRALYLELKSTKQIAKKEVRKYSFTTRSCLFHDDVKNEYSNLYSYSACLVLCRIKTIQSLCKCTPFSMATQFEVKNRVCLLHDLKCLNKYREKVMYYFPKTESTLGLEIEVQDSIDCQKCWPDCELTQHYTKEYTIPISPFGDKHYESELRKGVNMTNKSFLHIFHSGPSCDLVCLDVVSYWQEILSNIGGFCGIISGLSLFSVLEVIYFLFVRVVQNFVKNYRTYH